MHSDPTIKEYYPDDVDTNSWSPTDRLPIRRVYIAGPLTPHGINDPNPVIDYMINARNMIRLGFHVMEAGFTPFCAALDFLYFLLLREDEVISEEVIKAISLNWLEVCDAVLLVPNWELSSGAKEEVSHASRRGIPVFKSLKDLMAARGGK